MRKHIGQYEPEKNKVVKRVKEEKSMKVSFRALGLPLHIIAFFR